MKNCRRARDLLSLEENEATGTKVQTSNKFGSFL
jgi:hypothetical protein